MEFDILHEGQRILVKDVSLPYFKRDLLGTVKTVVSPTHFMIESDEVEVGESKSIFTFHLLTETMEYKIL